MDILGALTTCITALKEIIGLAKEAKDMLPHSDEKSLAEKKIEEAEMALLLAEVKTAESLGYPLCKCSFPPKIMLSTSHSTVQGMESVEVYRCPSCKKVTPTEADFVAKKEQRQKAIQRARGYSVK